MIHQVLYSSGSKMDTRVAVSYVMFPMVFFESYIFFRGEFNLWYLPV